MPRQNGLTFVLLTLMTLFTLSLPAFGAEQTDSDKAALQRITQESSNPVGELWLITNQFNMNLEQSPKGQQPQSSGPQQRRPTQLKTNFQESRPQYNYNFQPVLKFDFDNDWRLITRPLVPLYDSPSARGNTAVDYVSGLGDIQMKALLSPVSKAKSGFVWGAGPAAVFPTATDTRLGDGKWQLGGAVAALYINDKWVVGMFPQHVWSVGGDPSRKEVSLTTAQYFIWYSPAPTWQVGMSPTVLIDWLQTKSEDAVTLPVGLGLSKTVRIGKMPVKFGVEVDYAVVRPRQVPGNEWTFKLSIIPIIPQLF
jgi:hypothetical protein